MVQSPFAQARRYRPWGDVSRLLGGHYSSFLAPTGSCANPVASPLLRLSASLGESLQVATSPCCQPDLPDVISANLSSDAWSLTTTGPRECIYLFSFSVSSAFPNRGLGRLRVFTREYDFSRKRFSRQQTFLDVQASEFAHLPDRSYRCVTAAGQPRFLRPSRTCFVSLRMHRIC